MSNGLRFLILPITHSILFPSGIFLVQFYSISVFFYHLLIIIGSILAIWNTIEYWLVFRPQQQNIKKIMNAVRSRKLIRLMLIASIIFFVSEVSYEYSIYNKFLSEKNIELRDSDAVNLYQYKNSIFYSIFFIVMVLVLPLFPSDYKYNRSYAYFQIALNCNKKMEKIDYYQHALKTYSKYLSNSIDSKLKNYEQIHSKIISEDVLTVDNKIKSVFVDHENKLLPAIELSKWAGVKAEDIFQTNNSLESAEKWSRVLGFIATIILGCITVYLTVIK